MRIRPDVHTPIGNRTPLLCWLPRRRRWCDEPTALDGTTRPARRHAQSTAGLNHDDHLRLAARPRAPASRTGVVLLRRGRSVKSSIRYSRSRERVRSRLAPRAQQPPRQQLARQEVVNAIV